ncbi:hypothetical protein C8046_10805 [Serinibacter arcticus]|uniref:GyrI-like small molecule binding domain-containing protein n=2 Tax=Serinibacter arcticus TaxID=1655435 RepID=A0A2U1ZZU9_9MICO|nr:hypothetical protein C8046_10805 [Serinibacter arcticus]
MPPLASAGSPWQGRGVGDPAAKRDLKKEIASYAVCHGRFDLVTVPPLQYVMVDGEGDPNSAPAYRDALATLYPVAYGLKFLSARELGCDHVVMPLEALWWATDAASFTTARDKSRWSWTAMILVPDWIGPDHLESVRTAVRRKGGAPQLDALRLATLEEGLVAQTLHVGPYDDEGPVIEALHAHAVERGLRLRGTHHEIYLSDARRTAPERLRTILRQPVEPA